jgi:hypothetical protein
MTKRMMIMLAIVGLLFGGVFGFHAFQDGDEPNASFSLIVSSCSL